MEQPNMLTTSNRVTLDICANGFIVTLPGKSYIGDLTDKLMSAMPDIIGRLHEHDDPQMEAIKDQIRQAAESEKPAYELKPQGHTFAFTELQLAIRFIAEKVGEAINK